MHLRKRGWTVKRQVLLVRRLHRAGRFPLECGEWLATQRCFEVGIRLPRLGDFDAHRCVGLSFRGELDD